MHLAMKLWPSVGPLALLSTLALVGCESDRDRAGREPPARDTHTAPATPAGTTTATTVEAVKDAPERYFGKVVTVAGKIDQIYGDRAMDLEGAGWAFNDNITVLTRTPVLIGGAPLAIGDEVVVTGTVRPVVITEVEREIGWDIAPEVEIRISKRPVLIATAISKVGEYGRWSATAPSAGASEVITTALAILTAPDPATLAGRPIDLRREHVQAVAGKGLWIGPNPMSQVFVLPAAAVKDVKPGDQVRVTGTLRKAPKDAAKAWGLPSSMEGAVNDRMVFIDATALVKAAAGTPGGTAPATPGGTAPGTTGTGHGATRDAGH